MTKILPEGMLINTPLNKKYTADSRGFASAMNDGAILEGRALMRSADGNLTVEAGNRHFIIPRNETALGMEEGDVKDIAVLSRVGKCVSFMVVGMEGAEPILSRRAAQRAAFGYITESLEAGTVIPVTITHLDSFGAFVDIGCGLTSLIGVETTSVARIAHPSDRFRAGGRAFALVTDIDRKTGRVRLSHRELLGTWEENAAMFRCGDTVEGIVRGVKDYGIFIELMPNLSGLAEYREGMETGQRVSVFIKSINPEKRKIKLSVIDVLPSDGRMPPIKYFITSGRVENWSY